MTYDSTADTLAHIERVAEFLEAFATDLRLRAAIHDQSKLASPEKELLDQLGSQQNLPDYGSAEERERFDALETMRVHHYAHNRHHPEHHANGINGMTLGDVVEMLMDWRAATERHTHGDIYTSIDYNRRERFEISDQLYDVLVNTAREMGW